MRAHRFFERICDAGESVALCEYGDVISPEFVGAKAGEQAVSAAPIEEERNPALDEARSSARCHCLALEYHYVEVIEELVHKLRRVEALLEIYTLNQDQQMVILADVANVQDVIEVIGKSYEACDYASVTGSVSEEVREAIVQNFAIGNTFILVVDSAAVGQLGSTGLGAKAAVLVTCDLPAQLETYEDALFAMSAPSSRVHTFFSPAASARLAVPLMTLLEEAGNDIPGELLESL